MASLGLQLLLLLQNRHGRFHHRVRVERDAVDALLDEELREVRPIFDSLKGCTPDLQGLAKTLNGLGTTFPVL